MTRHLTTAVTMVVLLGLLVIGALWGWKSLTAELPKSETAAEDDLECETVVVKAGRKVHSKQVQVSVYNAGTRDGLAGTTLQALVRRGFVAGDAGNAPSDIEVRRVQVWSTVPKDARARLVARQFGEKARVHFVDEDLGVEGVDVIVGDGFRRLAQAPRAILVKNGQEFCAPVSPEAEEN